MFFFCDIFIEFHTRTIPTDSKLLQPASNEDLLIQPKKLINPVLQSKSHRNMQQEIKVNNKLGINVLEQKSELSRVFNERKREKNFRENNPSPKSEAKSEFEQLIEKRRNDIEKVEKQKIEEDNIPEFLKIKKRMENNK